MGKVAIITGGEGSIGMATARAFVAEGASVFLAGISAPDLKAGAAFRAQEAAKQSDGTYTASNISVGSDGGQPF